MTKALTQNPMRVAFYARYSCDQQRETSIDDQVRRCKELAEYLELPVSNCLIFTDSALSGQEHALDKREGMHALEKAWANNAFSIVILDGVERLARDGMEQEKLIKRIKENRRVRLLTTDGVDTSREGWELLMRLKCAISQAEISTLQHRVGRGMTGQLERGYMIAAPVFGYDLKREYDPKGNRIGTRWIINEHEADLVEKVFQRRKDGQSMHQIATWLNTAGVACSRKARKADGGYWRPSRVRNLLGNPIYRGEFIWHGSASFKHKANKRGEEVKEKRYARPELRLVSDETWELCNTKAQYRTGYGGGKNALAGLVKCGCCAGTLVLTAESRCRSLYCANCTVAKACNEKNDRLSVTVAAAGVERLLTEALHFFLTPNFVKDFHDALREKLTGGTRHECEACEKELMRLKRIQARLSHLLANVDEDDEVLTARYEEARRLVQATEAKLKELTAGQLEIDQKAVEAQLQIDPAGILPSLFNSGLPAEQLRAILRRLFPSVVLEGKQGRYSSIFRICFAPGAALSIASNSSCQLNQSLECRFMLRYVPDNRKESGPRWDVLVLDSVWEDAVLAPKKLILAEA